MVDRGLAEDDFGPGDALLRHALVGGRMGVWCFDRTTRRIRGDRRFFALWGLDGTRGPTPLSMLQDRLATGGGGDAPPLLTDIPHDGDAFETDVAIAAGTAERWIRWRGAADPGDATLVHGVAFDITEARAADLRLRDKDERQRLMLQLVPVLLWQADAAGHDISLTEAWQFYTGQTSAETANFGWLDAIHPDDLAATRAAFEHAFATGEPLEREQRIKQKGDGYRWHLVRHRPARNADGRIAHWFGAAIDIHESKLAAQALDASERFSRALVEGVAQLIWRGVDGGEWTWASPQWTAYTGQSDAASRGMGWLHMVHPDDRPATMARWRVAVDRGTFEADYRVFNRGEQRHRWVQTRAMPVRGPAGEVIEWLGTSTDVDDLRGLQDRQGVLVAELQHRTFNLLGMVRSLARSTARSSDGLAAFEEKFIERIDALARVQRMLSRLGEDDRVSFDELVLGELAAVGSSPAEDARVTLSGPAGVALRSGTVQTFAMAIHELVTNAVKYGALGQPDARLSVDWHVEAPAHGDPMLHVDWRESGVALPAGHGGGHGTGRGRDLIEHALPYQLGARTSYRLTDDGVHCSISVRGSRRTSAAPPPPAAG